VTVTFEQMFTALWVVGAMAFLACGYYSLRFTWKLQDALNRKLIPSSLIKGRMNLIWMFAVGDIVPGTAHYRQRCKIALVIAVAAWLALFIMSGMGPRE
jgi:hypothetical protein